MVDPNEIANTSNPHKAISMPDSHKRGLKILSGHPQSLACIIHEEKTKQKNKQLASKLIWKEMERKKIANMTNKTLKNELKKLKLCCVDIVIL